jgi:hypothetical protein
VPTLEGLAPATICPWSIGRSSIVERKRIVRRRSHSGSWLDDTYFRNMARAAPKTKIKNRPKLNLITGLILVLAPSRIKVLIYGQRRHRSPFCEPPSAAFRRIFDLLLKRPHHAAIRRPAGGPVLRFSPEYIGVTLSHDLTDCYLIRCSL